MTLVADEPSRLAEVYQATASLEEPGRLLLPRLLLGITGAPGSGKSTLTDALIREYRTALPGPPPRRGGRGPLLALHGRRRPRRPRPDDAACHRPDGVRPIDGIPRTPGRPGARREGCHPHHGPHRVRCRLHRNGGRGTERGRGGGCRGPSDDRHGARPGRQRAVAEGRLDGNRRLVRREQGGQAGRRPAARRPARHVENGSADTTGHHRGPEAGTVDEESAPLLTRRPAPSTTRRHFS